MAGSMIRILSNSAVESGKDAVGGAVKLVNKWMPYMGAGKKTEEAFKTTKELLGKEGRAQMKEALDIAGAAKTNYDEALETTAKTLDLDQRSLGSAIRSGERGDLNIGDQEWSSLQEARKRLNAADSIASDAMSARISAPLNTAKNYMTGEGSLGLAAARYGTVAVAGRYLSGGTLTRNNTGERDIAGIPFI